MTIRTFFLLGSMAVVGGRAHSTDLSPHYWQFFIDDQVVARATGFDRVVHHPRPMGVVIANDQPWESKGVAPYFFARKADGTFFCYYDAVQWVPDPEGNVVRNGKVQHDRAQQYVEVAAYATSRDGMHWEKPNLSLVDGPTGLDWGKFPPYPSPVGSSKKNNLGVPFTISDLGTYGNVADPAKRYAISYEGKAYFSASIPDFIQDRDWKKRLVPADGTFSPREAALHFWDAEHAEWVAIIQNAVPHWLPGRQMARFSSKDLKTWVSEIVLDADPGDPHRSESYDEPMVMSPFYCEGVVLGLMSWMHTDRTNPDGGPVMPLAEAARQGWPWPMTPENPYPWPFARKGPNEMRITISRDGGHTWDRQASREAWIPHGTEQGSYDRCVLKAPAPPVRVGDEDWFYIGVWDADHLSTRSDANQSTYYHDRLPKGQIALYVQKHNRYVSLTAGSQPETLITKPFTITGESLELNVDASRGRVRVGIAEYNPVLTLNGTTYSTDPHLMEKNILEGYTRADCVPIEANSIEHVVQFKKGSSLKALQGRRVVLFIELQDADLYCFRIR